MVARNNVPYWFSFSRVGRTRRIFHSEKRGLKSISIKVPPAEHFWFMHPQFISSSLSLSISHSKMASPYYLVINTNIVSGSPIIDESFNLDEALTMITNTSSTPPDQDQPKSYDGQTNSELTVSSLPTVAATEGRCTVCMEDFLQAFPGKQVPCGHVFHATCISTWISLCNSCPVCRSGVIA